MAKFPARLNDPVNNGTHGNGSIISTKSSTLFQGQPVACVDDTVKFADGTEGSIIEGKACVEVNGKRIALMSDTTQNDGVISAGASGIQVDEGDPFVFIGNNVEIGPNVIFSKTPMEFYDQHFQLISASTGEALANVPYRIHTPQGIIEGITDHQGNTLLASSASADEISIDILQGSESSGDEGLCSY